MTEAKVIMYDDPALVEPVTVQAFKGVDGNVYMTESAARWTCCTHVRCDNCGGQAPRGWLLCDNCRKAVQIDRYNQLDKQEWDGKTPLYSESHDEFFFDEDSVRDFLCEALCTTASMRFVICKPINLSEVDADHWEDELPDGDGPLPSEVQAALDKLNEAIREHGKAVSCEPSKVAATFKTFSWA